MTMLNRKAKVSVHKHKISISSNDHYIETDKEILLNKQTKNEIKTNVIHLLQKHRVGREFPENCVQFPFNRTHHFAKLINLFTATKKTRNVNGSNSQRKHYAFQKNDSFTNIRRYIYGGNHTFPNKHMLYFLHKDSTDWVPCFRQIGQ